MNRKKTVLVTGGAGFIGSNFVKYLLAKHKDYRVIVLDALTYAGNLDNLPQEVKENPNFIFWQGNIRHSELVNRLTAESDMVIHFAAETHVARSIYDNTIFFETDVLGTLVVATAVLNNQNVERFIHISSSEVYGTACCEPMDEDHPLNPMSPYASAKAAADRLVYSYVQTYGIPAIIVRPFNNYGPNQHLEKVIPRFITSAIMNEPLTVHGTGESARDWLYVDDHCHALDLIMHTQRDRVVGQVINIGTGACFSVLEIAKMVLGCMGKSESLITFVEDRLGQVQRHLSSTTKAETLLGWQAFTPFEKGLEYTISWYRGNTDWWRELLWMKSIPMRTVDGQVLYY